MKEHPILFSGDMVKAILDGRKTMTRRVIKPQPTTAGLSGVYGDLYNHGPDWAFWLPDRRMTEPRTWPCPYGQPGDRLWVKETWRVGSWREDDGQIAVDFKADGFPHQKWRTVPDPDKFNDLWEESTQEAEKAYGMKERYKWKPGESPCRWRPSIFMPRWASRILLEITAVRVERAQDITEQDAKAEGAPTVKPAYADLGIRPRYIYIGDEEISSREGFRLLWDSLNAKRGYGWDANPRVWAISFRRLP